MSETEIIVRLNLGTILNFTCKIEDSDKNDEVKFELIDETMTFGLLRLSITPDVNETVNQTFNPIVLKNKIPENQTEFEIQIIAFNAQNEEICKNKKKSGTYKKSLADLVMIHKKSHFMDASEN